MSNLDRTQSNASYVACFHFRRRQLSLNSNAVPVPEQLIDRLQTHLFGDAEKTVEEDLSVDSDSEEQYVICSFCVLVVIFTWFRARGKRKKRKHAAFDDCGNVTPHKIKRIRQEMETKICEAQINSSRFII